MVLQVEDSVHNLLNTHVSYLFRPASVILYLYITSEMHIIRQSVRGVHMHAHFAFGDHSLNLSI